MPKHTRTPDRPHIHVTLSDKGWILEKIAQCIADTVPNVSFGLNRDARADIGYYVTFSARFGRFNDIELAYFAHLEREMEPRQKFFDTASNVDYCVCHSREHAQILKKTTSKPVYTIPPGVEQSKVNDNLRIGVIGRTYKTGRKGEYILDNIKDIEGVEFVVTGDGWPLQACQVSEHSMSSFYKSLDYVLVTSYYEGGPMCVPEAIANGTPVIAPDVGWVKDFPHIEYRTGDIVHLRRILYQLIKQHRSNTAHVAKITWKNCGEQYYQLFDRVWSQRKRKVSVKLGEEQKVDSVVLIVDERERSSLGGPSIRVPETGRKLRERSVKASFHFGLASAKTIDGSFEIGHYFNVWPPEKAKKTLTRIQRICQYVVFSPIVLDLHLKPIWNDLIYTIIDQCSTVRELDQKISLLRSTLELDGNELPVLPEDERIYRDALGNAHHVIAVSERERKDIIKLGVEPDNVTVVKNPVPRDLNGSRPDGERPLVFGRYVVCIGRIEARKNQLLLAIACKLMKTTLVLVGAVGDERYLEEIKSVAGDWVVNLGRINNEDRLSNILRYAEVFALVSWCEGAPLAALEAATLGKKMLLSNTSGESEYFREYAWYCRPYILADILYNLNAAVNAPWSQSSAKKLRTFVLNEYSWEAYIDETLGVYSKRGGM